MSGFYIDVEKADTLGILGRIRVKLNGEKTRRVLAAKSGRNGFVLIAKDPLELVDGSPKTKKFRGNVKISINPKIN